MSAVTKQTLDQSYTVLALLDVCAAAARNIENGYDGPGTTASLAGSLGECLDHVKALAGQLHDTLEQAEKDGREPSYLGPE
jgi:hypothetical protein